MCVLLDFCLSTINIPREASLMRLQELFITQQPNEGKLTAAQIRNHKRDIEFDETQPIVKAQTHQTRRPRLTLRMLNKMRKVKGARKAEKAEHLNFLPQMYGHKDELDDKLRVDLLKDKLSNQTELEKEKIKQRGEMEREKIKQRNELLQQRLDHQAELQKELLRQQTELRKERLQLQKH